MTAKEKRAAEKRISSAYRRSCSGVQVNIMDLPKIMAHELGILQSAVRVTDEELETRIWEFVETIRR